MNITSMRLTTEAGMAWLSCLLSLSLLSLTACSAVNYTTVFVHGEGGWPCIRIPTITECGGKLHAFAECRDRTGDGYVPTKSPAAGKQAGTSTCDDGGKTWVRSWLVTEADYAYSCLTHVARRDQVGLLWETSAQDCSGPSCQFVFSKITVL